MKEAAQIASKKALQTAARKTGEFAGKKAGDKIRMNRVNKCIKGGRMRKFM